VHSQSYAKQNGFSPGFRTQCFGVRCVLASLSDFGLVCAPGFDLDVDGNRLANAGDCFSCWSEH
jgi:hypothetical protein